MNFFLGEFSKQSMTKWNLDGDTWKREKNRKKSEVNGDMPAKP